MKSRSNIGHLRGTFVLLIGIGVMSLLVVMVLLLRPDWNTVQRMRQKIARNGQILSDTQDAVRAVEDYREREQQAVEQLARRIERRLPSDASVPSLLEQLKQAAGQVGVKDVSITTGSPRETTKALGGPSSRSEKIRAGERACWTVPVGVTGTAGYSQIAALLQSFAHCERLVTVSSVSLGGADSNGLAFELKLEAYFLRDAEKTPR